MIVLQNVACDIIWRMKAMIDASSLIVLAKLDALQEAVDIYGILGITQSVEQETVRAGKTRGYADAYRIEQAIANSLIIVTKLDNATIKRVSELRRSSTALSESDCHIIACAAISALPLVLQDRRARLATEAIGVETISIVGFPLAAYIRSTAKFERCVVLLDQICKVMTLEPAIQMVLRSAMDEIRRLRKANGDE
jgi:predicted nucleic acid-binding protein